MQLYGKLDAGAMFFAQKTIDLDGKTIVNPTDQQYRAAGWLPVGMTEPPETDEQHYPEARWEQQGDRIVQQWDVLPLPPREKTQEERISELEEELKAFKILIGQEA